MAPNNKVELVSYNNKQPELNGDIQVKVAEDEKKEDDTAGQPQPMVGVFETFRYATLSDKLLMLLGTLLACIHGSAMPVMMIVFGNMTDSFINNGALRNLISQLGLNFTALNETVDSLLNDPDKLYQVLNMTNNSRLIPEVRKIAEGNLFDQMQQYSIYYVIIACGVLVIAYGQNACWMTTSYTQSRRIRTVFFRHVLRKNIGWYDTHEAGELNTRLSDDINKIQEGTGDKLGQFFQFTATFLAGFIVGFVRGWKLTLVIVAVSPLLAISAAFLGKLGTMLTAKELKSYAKAGAVAEEVLSSMRTVVAFGGEQKECKRYNDNLMEARKSGVMKGVVSGGGVGIVFFIMFGSYALAFWYGSKLVREEDYTPGRMIVVFFSVLIGAFSLGTAVPNIQFFSTARGAAHAVYRIIDEPSEIDSASEEGLRPDDITGEVQFKNVVFNYPSRPDVPVLQGLNLHVNIGETVALVGSSGCGKSTTVQLLQRFYDPLAGEITLGGYNIKDLNIRFLRQKIGLVSQEPVLFATTIEENIRYGRDGVTLREIEDACRQANAHDFIRKLPNGYQTLVGERGAQLSGGQKQRIAIARALVRDPKLLLLDEATSALDTESESIVQAALDKARMGRTTIVIAHRLSTVRNADQIAGIMNGVVVEKGSHDDLMQKDGVYHTLVIHQQQHFDDDSDEEEEVNEYDPKAELKRQLSNSSGSPLRGSVKRIRTTSAGSDQVVIRDRTTSISSYKKEEEEEEVPEVPLGRIMKMNAPEWPFIVIGCCASLVSGGIQPAFAIIFSEFLGVFAILDLDEQINKTNFYSLMFLVIGTVAGLAMFVQSTAFTRSGEYLTWRLRQLTFKAFLRQEVAYFDDHKHNTGALTTRLATDASAVQGATGSRLGTIMQSLCSVGAGIVIGFIFSWKLTLVILAFVPLLMVSGAIQMRVHTGHAKAGQEAVEEAGKIATEALENIRTVASLTKEPEFDRKYNKNMDIPHKQNLKKVHIAAVAFGFSQAFVFFAYAALFSFGAWLIQNDGLEFQNMFKVFSAIVFSAMSVGQASAFAPDFGKAKIAANRIFYLLDREPEIDTYSEEGSSPPDCEGHVQFTDVHFNYPTRPDVRVLQGLNLEVSPGQRVALVGSSGCGKSTTIQLLERFYNPHEGSISIDGRDYHNLNIRWVRAQLGIVSQEPILFDSSIKDNIAYGDNSRHVGMEEIIAAARAANIHDFIASLPMGYDTNVGDKGTQLSGGQKQRIAIARALVRNPKILLLDEATSALDTESEKVVQEALDRAQEGRTSLVIAHRLSTIKDADSIAVIKHGVVVEQGTHTELINNKGVYYKLNNTNKLKK